MFKHVAADMYAIESYKMLPCIAFLRSAADTRILILFDEFDFCDWERTHVLEAEGRKFRKLKLGKLNWMVIIKNKVILKNELVS